MRTFLKALLFISLPLQYDNEMHENFATLYLCTFLSPDIKNFGTIISSLIISLFYY